MREMDLAHNEELAMALGADFAEGRRLLCEFHMPAKSERGRAYTLWHPENCPVPQVHLPVKADAVVMLHELAHAAHCVLWPEETVRAVAENPQRLEAMAMLLEVAMETPDPEEPGLRFDSARVAEYDPVALATALNALADMAGDIRGHALRCLLLEVLEGLHDG